MFCAAKGHISFWEAMQEGNVAGKRSIKFAFAEGPVAIHSHTPLYPPPPKWQDHSTVRQEHLTSVQSRAGVQGMWPGNGLEGQIEMFGGPHWAPGQRFPPLVIQYGKLPEWVGEHPRHLNQWYCLINLACSD